MSNSIFVRTFSPNNNVSCLRQISPKWYTWSSESKQHMKILRDLISGMDEPLFVSLQKGKPYDYTYTLDSTKIKNVELLKWIIDLSHFLFDLEIGDEIIFFSELLNVDYDGKSLHYLFSALRHNLSKLNNNPMSALYPPLGTTQKGALSLIGSSFPLHSDLYLPKLLFNVFDDVPNDSSGASLFLKVSELKKILFYMNNLSMHHKTAIINSLEKESDEDDYERFYDLLHGSYNYVVSLERNMRLKQEKIKLFHGQGYLLNDRKWLHGREAPSNRVNLNRVYRLVFNRNSTR
jgi:hypothetical protein